LFSLPLHLSTFFLFQMFLSLWNGHSTNSIT